MIGRQLSHFRILKKLGSGGMGEVDLAEDLKLERQAALKVLPAVFAADPDRMRRFVQEAKAASALNHTNVATIYEIAEEGDVRFIAMEFIDGRTLAELIPLHPVIREILDIATQTADALDAAHAKGIVHRDLTPGQDPDARSDLFFRRRSVRVDHGQTPVCRGNPETIEQLRHCLPEPVARWNYEAPRNWNVSFASVCIESPVSGQWSLEWSDGQWPDFRPAYVSGPNADLNMVM